MHPLLEHTLEETKADRILVDELDSLDYHRSSSHVTFIHVGYRETYKMSYLFYSHAILSIPSFILETYCITKFFCILTNPVKKTLQDKSIIQ